jgi:hypothetical protein
MREVKDMTTQERKCADMIDDNMKEREAQITALFNDPDSDENSDLALSIDTRKITTVCLSWGGPADYLEITHIGLEIERVLYRYSDWFDTASRVVLDDSPLYTYAQSIIESDGANYEAN